MGDHPEEPLSFLISVQKKSSIEFLGLICGKYEQELQL